MTKVLHNYTSFENLKNKPRDQFIYQTKDGRFTFLSKEKAKEQKATKVSPLIVAYNLNQSVKTKFPSYQHISPLKNEIIPNVDAPHCNFKILRFCSRCMNYIRGYSFKTSEELLQDTVARLGLSEEEFFLYQSAYQPSSHWEEAYEALPSWIKTSDPRVKFLEMHEETSFSSHYYDFYKKISNKLGFFILGEKKNDQFYYTPMLICSNGKGTVLNMPGSISKDGILFKDLSSQPFYDFDAIKKAVENKYNKLFSSFEFYEFVPMG